MKILTLISIVLTLSSCSLQKSLTDADEAFVSMRKTPCRGECSVYSVVIFESGLVKYEGKNYVGELGAKEKQLSKSELKTLKKTFEDADFFAFQDEYTAKVTDLSTTHIAYTHKGESKQIRDYFNAPAELKALEQVLEDVVIEWVAR